MISYKMFSLHGREVSGSIQVKAWTLKMLTQHVRENWEAIIGNKFLLRKLEQTTMGILMY